MEAEQSTEQHQEIPWGPNPWESIPLSPQGAFGSCYQLMELASGRVYAAKVIPRARLSMPGTRERVSLGGQDTPRRGATPAALPPSPALG